jgi:threonine dehydrogenase-like Zn-dependent dehydrogenase
MTHTVRSVVFTARDEVKCLTADEDLVARPDSVVVETRYSAISAGTELAKLSGLQAVDYPALIGNRAIGRVLEAGAQSGFQPGELVFAHTPHRSHAAPSWGLVARLPEALDRPDAALIGLAMVALTGVRVAAPEIGDCAVVTGAGLVGNLAAQLLELCGVRTVLVDRLPARLEIARQCGVRHTICTADGDPRDAVRELTGGAGADLLLECTGVPAVIAAAPELCARSATLILVGSPRGASHADLTGFLDHVHLWREHGDLTLKGAHEWKIPLRPDDFHKHSQVRNAACLAELMVEGRLRTAELVSRVYRPEDAAEAYGVLREGAAGCLGVVLDWTEG